MGGCWPPRRSSVADPALRAAFLAAPYGPARARFHLSANRGEAVRVCRGPWVIVTAWNPAGQRASREDNDLAQQRLLQRVQDQFRRFEDVSNGQGRWQEPALLVPGAGLRQALHWLRDFKQAAVVFGVGSRAALVWPGGQVERFWTVHPPPEPGRWRRAGRGIEEESEPR